MNTYYRKSHGAPEVFDDSLMAQAEREEVAQARRDRCAILWMASIVLLVSFTHHWPKTQTIPKSMLITSQKISELKSTINPNNTSWASLARLPGFGRQKARNLIKYRQQYKAANNQKNPFNSAEDLQKVKGIGPKTVDKIRKYITFQ